MPSIYYIFVLFIDLKGGRGCSTLVRVRGEGGIHLGVRRKWGGLSGGKCMSKNILSIAAEEMTQHIVVGIGKNYLKHHMLLYMYRWFVYIIFFCGFYFLFFHFSKGEFFHYYISCVNLDRVEDFFSNLLIGWFFLIVHIFLAKQLLTLFISSKKVVFFTCVFS